MATAQRPSASTDTALSEGLTAADPAGGLAASMVLARLRTTLLETQHAHPTLGRYRVAEVLGAGASGIVHGAWDPDLRRPVAIKVIEGAEAEERRRLLREARTLAQLSHRHVVTVFDAGTLEGGAVYIVMERASGPSLERWLVAARRKHDEIVQAFIACARGLAAAHRAGVAHGDFKPANVLTTDGRVLVADFGLARATSFKDGQENARAIEAQPSAHPRGSSTFGGTPAYAAPERHAGAPPSASSDQYSVCASLFEALVGELPDGRPAWTLHQMLRRVAVPASVGRAIVRGLATDPRGRWPSAEALADALAFRGRRYAPWFASVGLGAIVFASFAAMDPGHSEVVPVATPATFADAVDEPRLQRIDEAIGDGRFDEAAEQAQSLHRFALATDQPALEAEVLYRIGRAKAALGRIAQARDDLTAAVWLGTEINRFEPAVHAAIALVQVTGILQGKYGEALWWSEQARSMLERIDADAGVRADWHRNVGLVLAARGEHDEAISRLEHALALYLDAHGEHHWAIGASRGDLGQAHLAAGDPETATIHFERAVAINRAALGPSDIDVARALNNLANAQSAVGDHEAAGRSLAEAIPIFEQQLPRAHPDLLTCRENLATLRFFAGDLADARARYEQLLPDVEAAHGVDHPSVARLLENLGNTLVALGNHEAGLGRLERALLIQEGILGAEHVRLASVLFNLAIAELAAERPDHAATRGLQAIEILERQPDPEAHRNMSRVRTVTGHALIEAGHPIQGEAMLRRAADPSNDSSNPAAPLSDGRPGRTRPKDGS